MILEVVDMTIDCRESCGTIDEVLSQNGYSTAWIGKNQNMQPWGTSWADPFHRCANVMRLCIFTDRTGNQLGCRPTWER
jgi:arylsulfatase A-like enzyme